MGIYTGVDTDVIIKPNEREVNWLRWITEGIGGTKDTEPTPPSHPFFGMWRRTFLFRGWSAYFPEMNEKRKDECLPIFRRHKGANGLYLLRCAASLKNYENEVAAWISWLEEVAVVGTVKWRHEDHAEWSDHIFGDDTSNVRDDGL